MIQLAQRAVLNALVEETPTVAERHVNEAASSLRDDFITRLSLAQRNWLRKHRDDPDKVLTDVNDEKQALLFNGSLLEYGNTRGPWGNVNPIVSEILDHDVQ